PRHACQVLAATAGGGREDSAADLPIHHQARRARRLDRRAPGARAGVRRHRQVEDCGDGSVNLRVNITVRTRGWLYLAAFGGCAVAGGFVFSVGQMTIDNLHCRSSGYGVYDFLAYCRSKQYGDYEHGALYYGLEPAARDNIRNAQVIFLGSSKTQAGFSS